MNESDFVAYMKAAKKPAATIKGYLNSVYDYQEYLQSVRDIPSPDEASLDDLDAFVVRGMEARSNIYRDLWGVRMYYASIKAQQMENKCCEWMEFQQNETRKLSEFPKVDRESVKKLSAIGIKTVNQLLAAGRTKADRIELAERSAAPYADLLELVKLSDLSRLPGVKKVRCRLFYEAGLDCTAKVAPLEAEQVQARLTEYIKETGFEGRAPALVEAQVAVEMSRFLPQLVVLGGE